MFGLAYLFLSLVTFGLYAAWLGLLIRAFRNAPRTLAIRIPMALVSVVLALLPISGALVRPLMENACDSNGRVVRLSTEPFGAKDVVVSGSHYGNSSVVDLLANQQVESIHLLPSAEYGDARRIATTAGIHDGRAFSLRTSSPDNPACGPYYEMLVRSGSSAVGYTGVCAAFGYESLPETFLKVSELHRRERSWRTGFYAIDWEGVRLERVSEGKARPLLEVREFKHLGLSFPLLLGVTPIGGFSCHADLNAQSAAASVTPPNPVHHERTAFSKAQLSDQLASLENRFWGFQLPAELHTYDIWVFDHGTYATNGAALEVAVDVQPHDRPVLLKLSSNAKANWTVSGIAASQMVLVQTGASREPQRVIGVPQTHVWSIDSGQPTAPPLLKFYDERVLLTTMSGIQAGRYCKLEHRATGLATRIDVRGCPIVVK